MSHPWRLKELPPAVVRERLRVTGTLIIPSGTLEFRGAHLPLGCDSLILDRLADDLSARTGVPRAPTIEFGVHARGDETSPGTAALRRKTLHRVMNELIAAWEEGAGVHTVIVLTAHAAEAHQEALSTVRAVGGVRVVDIFSIEFGPLLEHAHGPVHGGELDTSLMCHLYPDLVSQADAVERLGASAAKGRRLYEFILERITESLLRLDPLDETL